MTLTLYNSLSQTKEVFRPLKEGQVSMYVCGPTVYNYIHIGNARSAVAFDTIRRYLTFRGYQVHYVSNFTDVDDKIIQAAQLEGMTPQALADKYIQAFKEDTGQIFVQEADSHPRVMDHIPQIIAFTDKLVQEGHAYEAEGDVYFRTRSYPDYGKLSKKSLEDLRIGASDRLADVDQALKEDPVDFALWKRAKPGEISWQSPWGPGRPGWHIECSVMAMEHLGQTIDIHGGGQDLEFPHHENEIAQSECHNQADFANYWLHNGFVTMGADAEKMSKSLGNFVLLRSLLEEVEGLVVRYLLATVHYRRPLNYSPATLQAAQHNVARLKEVLDRLDSFKAGAAASGGPGLDWASYERAFIQAMDDDINTANGMTVVFDLVKAIHKYLDAGQVSLEGLVEAEDLLRRLLEVFGLIFEEEADLDTWVQDLIDERTQARKEKDFARADAIRDQLRDQGILLDDTPQGTRWKRVD